ncbi:MAG TPA: hypothetical protein VJV05_09665 [Pyrinomonadaceae bacterium]|nr:hypothetical protein [Pyrinomonadaceae bacterium]
MFVVAFICLNAGGAVCVAYCQSMLQAADSAEHCPLKKTDSHCNKKSNLESDATAIGGDEIFCCSVTVGFLPAPTETPYRFVSVILAPVVVTPALEPFLVSTQGFESSFDYRGPPPLDRRIERIKHRLLRI